MLIYDETLSIVFKKTLRTLDLNTMIDNASGVPKFAGERGVYNKGITPAVVPNYVYWYFYSNSTLGGNVDLKLPFPYDSYKWWISETRPGQFLPMHIEPDVVESDDETIRLWIPLQDYMPGHIFVIEDKLVKDYKAGDVYRFDDTRAIHGAANITNIPRRILQVGIGGNYRRNK